MESVDRLSADLQWPASRFGSNHAWLIGLLLAVVAVIAINPIGYIGGGMDDWQYLRAARCWREFGPCLPYDHWQARWPVIAPIAALTSLFGENRWSVGLAALVPGIVSLILLTLIGNRLTGRPIGYMAALLLLFTPTFSTQLLDPSVEATELSFCLLSAWILLRFGRSHGLLASLFCGFFLGLAFQVRETSFSAVILIVMLLVLWPHRPTLRLWLAAGGGFLLPIAVEFCSFFSETGDPLWRRKLSIAHTQIKSTELLGPIDRVHSPFFNPAYIANWRREPGVHIHWIIDGLVNMFVNANAGLSLFLIPTLLLFFYKDIGKETRNKIWLIYVGSIAYMCVLIFAFAIDPKPRMMTVPLAALSIGLAILLVQLRSVGKNLACAVAALAPLLLGTTMLVMHAETYSLVDPAIIWVRRYPEQINVDENTRRVFAMVPEIWSRPVPSSQFSLLMIQISIPCDDWLRQSGFQSIKVEAKASMSHIPTLDWRTPSELCLFRAKTPVKTDQFYAAVYRINKYTLIHQPAIFRFAIPTFRA